LRGNDLGHIVWDTYEQIVEDCCSGGPHVERHSYQDSETVTSVTKRAMGKVTN